MAMNSDVELETEAMRTISKALSELDDVTILRVLRWACERYGSENVTGNMVEHVQDQSADQEADLTIGELFARIGPVTESDKVLAMAYVLKTLHGQDEVTAQAINRELAHLGHRIANITRAFDKLKATKPQLMIQTRKSGSSQQARKTFRLTEAGIHAARSMEGVPL
jgi:hypothetical protein